jgi:hypothetical protein
VSPFEASDGWRLVAFIWLGSAFVYDVKGDETTALVSVIDPPGTRFDTMRSSFECYRVAMALGRDPATRDVLLAWPVRKGVHILTLGPAATDGSGELRAANHLG